MTDGNGGFDWGLTPRKPEPEKPEPEATEPETPKAEEPKPEPDEPDTSAWVGEPTQAMLVTEKPFDKRPPLPSAPTYPPPQQFRPPSQYPQSDQPAARAPAAQEPAGQEPAQPQPPQPWQLPTTALPQEPATTRLPDAAASATSAKPTATTPEQHDIDDIFGEHAFQEYDDGALIGQLPTRAERRTETSKPPAAPLSRAQIVLMSLAGGLVAALALIAIYLAGTNIDLNGEPKPAAAAPTAVETEEPVIDGPVQPGVHAWDELQGTECLQPFENAWQQEYTVVDCEEPHAGQLTARGDFEATSFPGAEALASEANLACASTKVINYKKAGVYDDVAISASYPTTEQEWDDGFTGYFCFVNLTSGEPITGTIARAFGTAAK